MGAAALCIPGPFFVPPFVIELFGGEWREGGLSHDFDEYDVWPLMMVIFIAAERADLRRMH